MIKIAKAKKRKMERNRSFLELRMIKIAKNKNARWKEIAVF
jgi:hypothetical protein